MSTMKCPKCRRKIPFDATTHDACGWNVDSSVQNAPQGAALCEWNEYGERCHNRGILSPGTAGRPWYCREHFYKLRGYPDKVRGNELPGSTKTLAEVQAEADAFCAAQGLVTVGDKRAWIREKMKGFGKIDPAEHWQRVLATPGLPELSYHTAREALKNLAAEAPE